MTARTTTGPTEMQESIAVPASRGLNQALAGTRTLIRFILRRDRITLPAWILGMSALLTLFVPAISSITETEEQRRDLLRIMDGATGAVFGPGYGRYDITPERYIVGVYGLFFFILASLMSMMLVSRHTRAEEQHGRAELVRTNVVGRHAQLTAVLLVAVGANTTLALALGGIMAAGGFDAGDGLLFGASVGAVGLVFAALTAVTVQVTEFSRTATGITGAVLGASWVVRVAGDMMEDYGSPLSWFSPLAWSNQTRPYVDGRWWPLLLSAALAVGLAAAGFALSSRRDVGAGLVAARTGASVAAPWLRSPLAAAFRLQRRHILGWTLALSTFGAMFGALGEEVANPEGMSSSRVELFGGSLDTVLDGYLGMITLFTAVLAGIMVVQGIDAVRSEETGGRAEPILATATGRRAWFGSYLAVLSAGLVGLLAVAGFATGTSAAIATGESSYVGELIAAHVAHAPGVLVDMGVAALLFGLRPRMIGMTWAMVGYSLFVGLFGTLMDMPAWARNLSPMEHVGQPPLDSISSSAVMILLALAAALMAVGLTAFRRRDLETK